MSPPSFEVVFRDAAPAVYRALRRLGIAESDLDDVCQEVFVTVHKRLHTFEGRSSARTWVYAIAVRVAADHRKHSGRREIPTEIPDSAATDDPHAELARKRALTRLDVALSSLDDDKRAVFVLYEIEGLSMPEVAEAMGCPLQTAYSRHVAARKLVLGRMSGVRDEVLS